MRLKRKSKFFADVSPNQAAEDQRESMITSKDLTAENMKLQRQIMMNQRQRQRLEAEERNSRIKSLAKIQQAEAKKDQEEKANQVKVAKMQESNQLNPANRNWHLVKSSAKVAQPVPMKN